MLDLFKNTLRSIKSNKLSVIGLTFLTFLATTVFTTLNSSVTSINNKYNDIASEGKLHDFTVSELYDVGIPNYVNNKEKWSDQSATYLFDNDFLVKSNDAVAQIYPYIKATLLPTRNNNKYHFEYHYLLDVDKLDNVTSIKKFYLTCKSDPELWAKYQQYFEPLFSVDVIADTSAVIADMNEVYNYCTNVQKPYGKNSSEITPLSGEEINRTINKISYGLISKQIEQKTKELIQVVSEQSTLLNDYLSRQQKDYVDFRYFSSVNIGNTADDKTGELKYYKAVLSNPEDTIDKMCTLSVNSEDKQWGNFSIQDCTYGILNHAIDDNYSINDTIKTLPKDITDEADIHYVEKIFLIPKGSHGSTPLPAPIDTALKALTEKDGKLLPVPNNSKEECQKWWTENKQKLVNFLTAEKNYNEEIYLKDSKAVIQWIGGAGDPASWELQNWTSYFTVVGSQFMQANNKHTIDDAMYANEESYQEYVKNNPRIFDEKSKFIGWLNTLTFPEIEDWFVRTTNSGKFDKSIIKPGGSTSYIITGSGLTPDYIYPIVSLDKFTPDSNKECVFFASSGAYARIYDAYRGSQTENFVVGKFKTSNKQKQQQIIDEINQFAINNMVFPKGMKAAYFASDTSNVLNTSAFRISYIPKFIDAINSVALSLTIFIAILTFIISSITIHRYIVNNQTTLGIMRANGYSKFAIATSLMPFAIITSLIGGIAGILIGVVLEVPTLSLFKNYWTLPTPTVGFSWLSLVICVIAAFVLLMSVIYITSLLILKKNTVDLMKTNSQDNPSFLSKFFKAIFFKTNVITKFRISVAFSSFWKLIILIITTSLTLSSLVFAMSIHGKLETSINATNESRKYKYAVSLYTPTIEGGQYTPVAYSADELGNFNGIGMSGFNQAGNDPRDNNYTQSIYYGLPLSWSGKAMTQYSLNFSVPGLDYGNLLPKISAYGWENSALNQYINKPYYYSSWALAAQQNKETSIQDAINLFWLNERVGENTNNMLSNLFMPYAGDTLGQSLDIFYLKDRAMTKSSLDYNVGVGSAIRANPWDIAVSLMPDNQKNLCETKTQNTIDFVGNALYYVEGKSNPKYEELYKILSTDPYYDLYKTFIPALDNNESSYHIDRNKAMYEKMSVSLKPQFVKLLKIIYTYEKVAENDFSILYNSVPIGKNDETYTWIDASVNKDKENVKILGIKATKGYETKYVDLVDKKGNNLLPLIAYSYDDLKANKSFPIVANAYAQHKYNLHKGDKISFTINNLANRIHHQIRLDNNLTDPNYNDQVTFEVVGICNTYEGQEYFVDQDVANYVLGLKSHLLDADPFLQMRNQPNNYYPFMYDTIGTDTMMKIDFQSEGLNTKASLINLKNYQSPQNSSLRNYNITPYGFNGVFTESEDGGPELSKSTYLYSSSGLYPANDKITSTTSHTVFRYGSNTQIACQMAYDAETELGKKINQAYLDFINAPVSEKEAMHDEFIKYSNELIEKIRYYYGETAYTGLTTSVIDFDSNKTVYETMSQTISSITFAVLVVMLFMVMIITALITNMIINDSKRLASLLKAIGYTDIENAYSFLSIYVPVIFIGLLLSLLLSWGFVVAYNSIVFNGIGIWLNSSIQWWYYIIGVVFILTIFGVSATGAIYSIKKNKLTNAIK